MKNIKINFKDKNLIILSVTAMISALLLVSTMYMQFKSVDESKKVGLESLREDELKTQISTYKTKYKEMAEKQQDNLDKIQKYKDTFKEEKKSSELLDEEMKQSNSLLGLTDVTGEGVIITLNDTKDASYTSENLRYLVNELKFAGAEAISINGNRLINLTDIVTLNGSFITMYNGAVRLTSPFVVKAIGDKKYLSSTLNLKQSGFVDMIKSENLDIKVEESNFVSINKYNRDISIKYLKEEEKKQ